MTNDKNPTDEKYLLELNGKYEIALRTLIKIAKSHNYDFKNWKLRGDDMQTWAIKALQKINGAK